MELHLDKSFFTFATGKKYLALAFALARSYKYHNSNDITFAIASNENFNLPRDLHWVNKIIVSENEVGLGLNFKFHLPEIAPTARAIFIDADSLIYSNIAFLFDVFKDKPNVIGTKVLDGFWVDENIEETINEFDLNYMIRYCGALYYVIKNKNTSEVFDFARELSKTTRKFQRNEKTIYDEPILSIALSKYRIEPIIDDGNIWGDLVHFKYESQLNIFKSPPIFDNNFDLNNYKFWLPKGNYMPLILHVGSGNYNKKPWIFESIRLKLNQKFYLPTFLSDWIVKLTIIPIYQLARKLLR